MTPENWVLSLWEIHQTGVADPGYNHAVPFFTGCSACVAQVQREHGSRDFSGNESTRSYPATMPFQKLTDFSLHRQRLNLGAGSLSHLQTGQAKKNSPPEALKGTGLLAVPFRASVGESV